MWNVILSILSVIGIILLVLLILLLAMILIVLFYPITYRVKGQKTPENTWLSAKVNWLFGLVRVRYAYPEPGKLTVKLLWKTIFDSGKQTEETSKPPVQDENTVEQEEKTEPSAAEQPVNIEIAENTDKEIPDIKDRDIGDTSIQEEKKEDVQPEAKTAEEDGTTSENKKAKKTGIREKITKIKYTIQKIYDKIKEVWVNLSYYKALLQEENTFLLWNHVKRRVGKVLKNIRPRHIKADVLFGTGSPDTTGYASGVYGMLLPILGRQVNVTPDFTQAILEGRVDISGHISVFVIAWNGLRLIFDKKLHLFIKKLKRNGKQETK